jgi:DNA-binding transcriptional LysR family regulator
VQLDDMDLFTRLARTRSLSEAARQLDITAASVSARLKRIETELEVRLVERTTRSLRLTQAGEQFLQTCEAIGLAWTQGQALLRQERGGGSGRIRIAAPCDTSIQFLCPWLGQYAKANPRLDLIVHAGDRMHELPREAVDIAIRYGELGDSSLVSRLLVRSERVLVAAPAYVKQTGGLKAPAQLVEHRTLAWLSRDQPKVQWSFRDPAGAAETVVVRPALCGDSMMVRQWAIDGHGIAYKAFVDVAADLRAQRLVRVLPEHAGEPVPISAVMPSGRYVPARVRALVEYLMRRFKAV